MIWQVVLLFYILNFPFVSLSEHFIPKEISYTFIKLYIIILLFFKNPYMLHIQSVRFSSEW